jgi:hypothetical protein
MLRASLAAAAAQAVGLAFYTVFSLKSSALRDYLADEPTWVLITLSLFFPFLSAISCLAVSLASRGRFAAALLPAAIAVYGQGSAVVSVFSTSVAYGASWITLLLLLTSATLLVTTISSFPVGLLFSRGEAAA